MLSSIFPPKKISKLFISFGTKNYIMSFDTTMNIDKLVLKKLKVLVAKDDKLFNYNDALLKFMHLWEAIRDNVSNIDDEYVLPNKIEEKNVKSKSVK